VASCAASYQTYDTLGRETLVARPDGNKTAIAYTYCTGLPTGESCPANAQFEVVATPETSSGAQNGPITVTYYDGLSRVLAGDVEGFDGAGTGCSASAPCWIRTATQYDALGRVSQTSRPYFLSGGTAKWTVYTYDTLGRATKATFPDASKTTAGFNGLTTTSTNDKSQTTTTTRNAQGRVASVTDANGKLTSYAYDAFGDLVSATDPASNVIANTYDVRGRKTASSDPDMGGWFYVYDGFGELYSQTDAKSQVTTFGYDALGRMTSRVEPDMTSGWVYDTATYGIGKIAAVTCSGTACASGGYMRSYIYDGLGRPSELLIYLGSVSR
jgi:YD repeat-containing protein